MLSVVMLSVVALSLPWVTLQQKGTILLAALLPRRPRSQLKHLRFGDHQSPVLMNPYLL